MPGAGRVNKKISCISKNNLLHSVHILQDQKSQNQENYVAKPEVRKEICHTYFRREKGGRFPMNFNGTRKIEIISNIKLNFHGF